MAVFQCRQVAHGKVLLPCGEKGNLVSNKSQVFVTLDFKGSESMAPYNFSKSCLSAGQQFSIMVTSLL